MIFVADKMDFVGCNVPDLQPGRVCQSPWAMSVALEFGQALLILNCTQIWMEFLEKN